jgi:hypothetical protein
MLAAASAAQPEEIAYLWPCNVPAWNAWCEVQTQWRYSGMGGRTGLCYVSVLGHLGTLGLCSEDHRDVYAGIRAAERATLQAEAEQNAAKKAAQQ